MAEYYGEAGDCVWLYKGGHAGFLWWRSYQCAPGLYRDPSGKYPAEGAGGVIYTEDKASRYNTLEVDKDNIVAIGTVNINKDYDGLIGKYDKDLNTIITKELGSNTDTYFNDIIITDGKYKVIGYSSYNNNYLTKFITYSDALRVLESK